MSVLGVPYLYSKSDFGGVTDGLVVVKIGIHSGLSADALEGLQDLLLAPFEALEGFSELSDEVIQQVIEQIKAWRVDEVQRLLLANLPGVGTDLILQAVRKLYDWQYKRVREKLVELVKATIDYSLVSYKISQGDKFPSASGVWVAPHNYHLVSYEVIVDEESITVFTDLVLIDLTRTLIGQVWKRIIS